MLNRRGFVKLSAASVLFSRSALDLLSESVAAVSEHGNAVHVVGRTYSWDWSADNDVFMLNDAQGRVITQGKMQPVIVVKASGLEHCSGGKFRSKEVRDNRLVIAYEGVNRSSTVTVTWRFETENLWLEPVVYTSGEAEDIVSLHYFAVHAAHEPEPSLQQTFLIQPGVNESTALSPIMPNASNINFTGWLGHGDMQGQAWGLPSHFFCGASIPSGLEMKQRGAYKEHRSAAFCCGLAELPSADLFLQVRDGSRCSPVLNIRGDLWGHMRGPGHLVLGSTFYWAIGDDYREAIRRYYLGLVRAGILGKKTNSPAKNSIVTASAFDTWAAQAAEGKTIDRFNQAFLEATYRELKASGIRPKLIILDGKWEGRYGLLTHDEQRFPHFDAFLAKLQQDGHNLGIWTAFIRCEDPAELGLNESHMLRGLDGKAIVRQELDSDYYLFDFTQPEVAQVIRDRVRQFVRRYNPALIKFDFGYELPSLKVGAPKNMEVAGERFLKYGIELIVKAMREVNPDIVLMYYSLSPLFIDCVDLHSPDDLFLCGEEYQIEANRRFFFSGLLGEIGMPTFSSTGYDWASTGDIWFDAAPIGSIASMNAFSGDEQDAMPDPRKIAKFNGLSQITRSANVFSVDALDPVLLGSTSGAHSSSWARLEEGQVVLLALRAYSFVGNEGVSNYKGIVSSTTSMVVGSKNSLSIDKTQHIGVVPYGSGEVSIVHSGTNRQATVIAHHMGAPPQKTTLPLQGNIVKVPLYESAADGSIVEWFEIVLS